MYGKWLYKEIQTEYGYCRVEIFRKGYSGSQIEIGALSANSLTLSLENLGTITDPIGKSVCSFSIIDTDQISYDDFFTPDATYYKVVVSTKVGNGAYVTRWSGYITPDFFAENLTYRTPISISARDNIGYLNDVDFDMVATTTTVRNLIQSAFKKIATDYPMNIVFATQKQTAEGVLAVDATISTALLVEGSWYEAIEAVLHDLGLQMRWVDNNTIAVLDLSQIPEYYGLQSFDFIHASGYREILPAWRELKQNQDYGVFSNFYRGFINSDTKLEYAANSDISSNVMLYQPAEGTQWRREGDVYFLNFFNSYNQFIDDNKQDSIFITGVAPTATNANVLATKMVYSQRVTQVNKQVKITFNLNDTLRTPLSTLYTRGEYNTFFLPYGSSGVPHPYKLKYRFNIFLRADDGSNYVMREDWVDEATLLTEQPFIEFTTEKLKTVDTGISFPQGGKKFAYSGYNNEQQYSLTINTLPKSGTLELAVYPWTFDEDNFARDNATYQRGAKISDITFAVQLTNSGISSNVQVGDNHNIKDNQDYKFGQVPQSDGDIIAYAGGLFYSDSMTAINGFQRNANGSNYNLLELVGREIIHFNKKNYNKLSGTIKNLEKEPLMFNRLFMRDGKNYAPFAYSLNVISNEMEITTMQEVEPYTTASFTQINSEVTTGGATVGGGKNTVLQYSEDAGNAKRIIELDTATDNEAKDAYIIIDNAGFPEAKKVHVSKVVGLDNAKLEEYLTKNTYLKKDAADKLYSPISWFTDGAANNTLKLGGQLPSYYATKSALDAQVTALNTFINNAYASHLDDYDAFKETTDNRLDTQAAAHNSFVNNTYAAHITAFNNHVSEFDSYRDTTDNRLDALEALWGVDNTLNALYPKSERGIYSYSFITSGGKGSSSSSGGGLIQSVYGYNDLGGTFNNNVLTDTFNAYAINAIYNEVQQLKNNGGGFSESQLWTALGTNETEKVIAATHIPDLSSKYLSVSGGVLTGRLVAAVASNDSVSIGNTSDYGYKFQVILDGSKAVYVGASTGILLAKSGNTIDAFSVDGTTSQKLHLNLSSSGDVTLAKGGGNVYIGNTTDYGHKFQVILSGTRAAYIGTSVGILLAKSGNTIDAFSVDGTTSQKLHLNLSSSGDVTLAKGGGNVLIGDVTSNGSKLQVGGNITATGAITAGSASDRRLKDNVVSMTEMQAINVLKSLNPVTFQWNTTANELGKLSGVADGFIADEYEKLIPNSGRAIWANYRAIDYTRVSSYLVKGWQLHETRIERLERENKELKAKVEQLERRA